MARALAHARRRAASDPRRAAGSTRHGRVAGCSAPAPRGGLHAIVVANVVPGKGSAARRGAGALVAQRCAARAHGGRQPDEADRGLRGELPSARRDDPALAAAIRFVGPLRAWRDAGAGSRPATSSSRRRAWSRLVWRSPRRAPSACPSSRGTGGNAPPTSTRPPAGGSSPATRRSPPSARASPAIRSSASVARAAAQALRPAPRALGRCRGRAASADAASPSRADGDRARSRQRAQERDRHQHRAARRPAAAAARATGRNAPDEARHRATTKTYAAEAGARRLAQRRHGRDERGVDVAPQPGDEHPGADELVLPQEERQHHDRRARRSPCRSAAPNGGGLAARPRQPPVEAVEREEGDDQRRRSRAAAARRTSAPSAGDERRGARG